jgi:hypothetical protein
MSSGDVGGHDYRSRFEQIKAVEAQKDALIAVSKTIKTLADARSIDSLDRSFWTALILSRGSVM